MLTAFDVDVGVESDEAGRPADLLHHRIAGIDAKSALNAAEIGAAADVDPGRTHMHALQTIDEIAGRLAVLVKHCRLLHRRARFTPIITIGAAWIRGHGHM